MNESKIKNCMKFRALKVYGSTQWFANSQKDYRRVFEAVETNYLYAEFSFFNKKFDEENWSAHIKIVGIDMGNQKTLCTLKKDIDVSKGENIIYVREGWGSKNPGGFWKMGTYKYKAYIDNTYIAETIFYVNDKGLVSKESNPYFNLKSLRLYEGPNLQIAEEDRVYVETFDTKKTKYVWSETKLISKTGSKSNKIPVELFYRFVNDAGQLKGTISHLSFIENGLTYTFTEGWGNQKEGTWFEGMYSVEILFMGKLIAVMPFKVGVSFQIEKEPRKFSGTNKEIVATALKPELTFEQAVKELDDLIGLEEVKTSIHEYADYLQFLKIRKEKGIQESGNLRIHSVFTGNPGTGKTTVARMLGKIYKSIGILSSGHLHEVDRSSLVAQYIGQTAPMVKAQIKKARGGILFIDEAYALSRKDDEKDFGHEAIEIILKEMSDGPGDLVVIVAGYPGPMQDFLNSNPGLRSRFSNFIKFPDYTPDELLAIAQYAAKKQRITIDTKVLPVLHQHIVDAYRNRTNQFGNARYVNSILGEAKMNMGLRIMKDKNRKQFNKKQLSTIILSDIEEIFNQEQKKQILLPIDETLLTETLEELNQLIGLCEVKNEINELVKLVRYYREIGKDIHNTFSLHVVFTGNPGTGKTTVARILVRIYKALGILERGHLVECDRESLVAGFVGQTAIKTAEKIDQAIGGGLFIDEAYSLSKGGDQDFGREAIETLLKRMEDHRSKFVVIAAGYPAEMLSFIHSNPGLESRFDKTYEFEDFSSEELLSIFKLMLSKEALTLSKEAENQVSTYIEELCANRTRYFGNARAMRKLVGQAVKKQNLRMADIPATQRTEAMIHALILDDVDDFEMNKQVKQSGIGFKFQ